MHFLPLRPFTGADSSGDHFMGRVHLPCNIVMVFKDNCCSIFANECTLNMWKSTLNLAWPLFLVI